MANGQGMGSLGWAQGAGSFVQAWGLIEAGQMQRIAMKRAQVRAEFASFIGEKSAGEAIAISQRQAAEETRQASIIASRALAVAAASGASVSDPTMVNILASAKGEGALRASVALYEGEARARQLRIQAVLGGTANPGSTSGYNIAAAGTINKGASSLYAKYGLNGPSSAAGDNALIDNDSSAYQNQA